MNRFKGLVAILGLFLLFAAGAWGLGRWRKGTAGPASLVWQPEPGAWTGLSEDERRGVITLVSDHLHSLPGVLVVEGRPGQPPSGSQAGLVFRGRRQGERLVLEGQLREGGAPRAWRTEGSPRQALLGMLSQLGYGSVGCEALLPEAPGDAWACLALAAVGSEWDLDGHIRQAEELLMRQPTCGAANLALADLLRRRLNARSDPDPQDQILCRARYEEVLRLVPGFVRGAWSFSLFLTEEGDQRTALDLLFQALGHHPQAQVLWGALAYPARTVGLLEGARRALAVRDRLQGHATSERMFADNVYLYDGSWDRFERNLHQGGADNPDPVVGFYRGYIRLLKGDPQQAKAAFRSSVEHPASSLLFSRLSQVFLWGLEGETKAALAELDGFHQRTRMRVHDGEFTFKVAEAYALLGRPDEALLMAERAFDQGFCCAAWYEAAPLLAPVRSHPRWKALLQHVRERQALLESRFPAGRFSP